MGDASRIYRTIRWIDPVTPNFGRKVKFGPARLFGSAIFAALSTGFGILKVVGFVIHVDWLAWFALAIAVIFLALATSSLDNYLLYNEDGISVRKCELGVVPRFMRFKYSEVRQIQPDQGAETDRYRCLQISLMDGRYFLVPEISVRNRPGTTPTEGSRFIDFIIELNQYILPEDAGKP